MSELHYARMADVYDDFVTTEIDVPFFIQEAKKAGGEILELMAGTGRLTIPLLNAGIPVTRVDFLRRCSNACGKNSPAII